MEASIRKVDLSETPTIRLTRVEGSFVVCRFAPDTVLQEPPGSLVSITRTADELSVVCQSDHVQTLGAKPLSAETGFACLKVIGPLPFEATGIMARLTVPLARAGISIFAISTYDTDYLFVSSQCLEQSIALLCAEGSNIHYQA